MGNRINQNLKINKMAKEFNDANFQNDVIASDKLTVCGLLGGDGAAHAGAIGPVIRRIIKGI